MSDPRSDPRTDEWDELQAARVDVLASKYRTYTELCHTQKTASLTYQEWLSLSGYTTTHVNQKILLDQAPAIGLKYDSEKPDMSLLSSIAIEELAKVLSFGKGKYAAHNWRLGITSSRLLAALFRHGFAYLRGEDKDPETGLSHIAHAMCCCMFLLELAVTKPALDDRFKVVPAGAVEKK